MQKNVRAIRSGKAKTGYSGDKKSAEQQLINLDKNGKTLFLELLDGSLKKDTLDKASN